MLRTTPQRFRIFLDFDRKLVEDLRPAMQAEIGRVVATFGATLGN